MMMFDKYAYINGLRKQHPGEKVLFSLSSLFFLISTRDEYASILIFCMMSIAIIVVARIPFLFYVKSLFLPIFFLLMSIIAIIIEFSKGIPIDALLSFRILNYSFFITEQSLQRGINLFLVSFASVSCLYFLILSTTIFDLLQLLKKLHVPPILLELFMYVYRFIFIVLEQSVAIFTAQQSRLGYATYRRSFRSLALLIASLFSKSMIQSQQFAYALQAKNDDGMLRQIKKNYRYSKRFWLFLIFYVPALLWVTYS